MQHHLDISPETQPFMVRPYRAEPAARQEVAKQIDKMIQQDVIGPAQCEWVSIVVLATKAGGSWRFSIDYGRLDSITERNTYPLPRMDDCVDSLWYSGCGGPIRAGNGKGW